MACKGRKKQAEESVTDNHQSVETKAQSVGSAGASIPCPLSTASSMAPVRGPDPAPPPVLDQISTGLAVLGELWMYWSDHSALCQGRKWFLFVPKQLPPSAPSRIRSTWYHGVLAETNTLKILWHVFLKAFPLSWCLLCAHTSLKESWAFNFQEEFYFVGKYPLGGL